jgi:hypothetical protein
MDIKDILPSVFPHYVSIVGVDIAQSLIAA